MENLRQLEELFHTYNELDPEQRDTWLGELADEQPELHRRLNELLAGREAADRYFEAPLLNPNRDPLRGLTRILSLCVSIEDIDAPVPMPEQIDGHEIVSLLGAGGMGVVYRARQQKPVVRDVALKVVRSSHNLFHERLAAERQALALMNHDGIARLYHSGTTEQGHPYFTMEYIEGSDISKYTEEQAQTARERVTLFCQAVAGMRHAHERGVIHGDLKPSNILVTEMKGEPQCKIIDFGVARACKDHTTGLLAVSQELAFGSPAFMSPEQKKGRVDTLCDVFALGAVLTVLLEPPGPDETIQTARERVSGEVRWILEKAMAEEPGQRYATVKELGDDLERYLNHRPLSVAPASARYRFTRWVRRNRVRATILAALTLGSLIALTATVVGYVRTERARAETEQALQHLQKSHDFYNEVFRQPHPYNHGREIKFVDVLKLWEETLPAYAVNDPLLEARVRITLGETYLGLGLYTEASNQFERSYQLRRTQLGSAHEETWQAQAHMARAHRRQGQHRQARDLLQEVLAWQVARLPENHPDRLLTLTSLAALHVDLKQFDEAQAYVAQLERQTDRTTRAGNDRYFDLADIRANIHLYRGALAEAAHLQQQSLAEQESHYGADHPRVLMTRQNLAGTLRRQKRYAEAERQYREISEHRQRLLGDDHPYTLGSRHGLVLALYRQDKLQEAAEIARDVYERRNQTFGPNHRSTLDILSTRASIAGRAGDYPAAVALYETLLARYETIGQGNTKAYARDLNSLGHYLGKAGQTERALKELSTAHRMKRELHGENEISTILTRVTQGQVQMAAGRLQEAERILAQAVAQIRQYHPQRQARLAEVGAYHGNCLLQLGRHQTAEKVLKEALALTQENDQTHRQIRADLVTLYERMGQPQKANRYR